MIRRPLPKAKDERPNRYARAWRSSRFWNRSTWPAVSMIVCLPVKNGWQFAQTSTRSSGLVEPTVHSVPQDPQCTLAWKYLGWISGFTMCSPPTSSVPGSGPAGDRRLSPVGPSGLRGCGRARGLDGLDPDSLLALGGVLELDLPGLGR